MKAVACERATGLGRRSTLEEAAITTERAERRSLRCRRLSESTAVRRLGPGKLRIRAITRSQAVVLVEAQRPTLPDRPAHDAPQHITTPHIRGQDAVGDQGRRPSVINDHPQRNIGRRVAAPVS